MRGRQIALFSWLALATSFCNAQTEGYTLHGQITGLTDGRIKLFRYNEDDRTTTELDSAVLTGGAFILKGRLDYPQMLSAVIQPGNWSFSIFLENGDISVKGDTTGSRHFDYTRYGGDIGATLEKVRVTGSQSQADWDAYQADPAQKQYEPIFAALGKALEKEKDVDREYRIRDRIDSVATLQNTARERWVKAYITDHPGSVAGAYMLSQLYLFYHNLPLKDMTDMAGALDAQTRVSAYYKSVKDAVDQRTALLPGAVAPDFTLLKRDSSAFTLSSARGRYVMIDFWASWCHPCRQAIPHWKEIYSKYHAKGFDIVSVSDDNQKASWYKALDQEKMPWTQVDDEFPKKNMPARIGTLYMTAYIPFYVLLDKDGKILIYTDKESEIDSQLKKLID